MKHFFCSFWSLKMFTEKSVKLNSMKSETKRSGREKNTPEFVSDPCFSLMFHAQFLLSVFVVNSKDYPYYLTISIKYVSSLDWKYLLIDFLFAPFVEILNHFYQWANKKTDRDPNFIVWNGFILLFKGRWNSILYALQYFILQYQGFTHYKKPSVRNFMFVTRINSIL